jgi:hypothetical protein
MIEEIQKALEGLDKEVFKVHVIDDAWYSAKAMTRALGAKCDDLPSVSCVRVRLPKGMLELHPAEDGKIKIKCYCCFGGNPDQGTVALEDLKAAVEGLKDHYCPPWPG